MLYELVCLLTIMFILGQFVSIGCEIATTKEKKKYIKAVEKQNEVLKKQNRVLFKLFFDEVGETYEEIAKENEEEG